MGLSGIMRTGVSGMNAQSSKLGAVADNIANSSTTGYKRAETEFASQVLAQGGGSYNSGGVQAHTKYAISDQGSMSFTTSKLDLAVDGNGFFIVSDSTGAGASQALTRAGSFVPGRPRVSRQYSWHVSARLSDYQRQCTVRGRKWSRRAGAG
jgi:flagellar hook protein FlgE